MAAKRYIVPDPKGDRGPYSTDEIRTFVDAGTLRPTTRIRNAGSTKMVTAQQVVDGHATFAALAAGTEEIEPETLPPVAPVARARPRPATGSRTRTGSVGRTSTGTAVRPSTGSMGRPSTGAVGRTTRSAPRGEAPAARGTGRVTRRPAAGGKGRIVVAVRGIVVVVAVAVVIVFTTR